MSAKFSRVGEQDLFSSKSTLLVLLGDKGLSLGEVLWGGLAWSRLGDDFASNAVFLFVVFFFDSAFGNLTGDLVEFFRETVSSATMLLTRLLVSDDGW